MRVRLCSGASPTAGWRLSTGNRVAAGPGVLELVSADSMVAQTDLAVQRARAREGKKKKTGGVAQRCEGADY